MRELHKKLFGIILLALITACFTGCTAAAKRDRHAARADKYFAAGQYPQAEIEYFNVLRLDGGTNAHAIRQLGLIYSGNGRTLRAAPFLVKSYQLNTNDTEIGIKLATAYLGLGGFQEARNIATNVLQRVPTNAMAPLLLVESARTPEDVKTVQQQLETLVQNHGESAALNTALGALLVRQGKFPDAESLLRKAITLDPKSALAHSTLGSILWALTNRTEATTEFKMAAELAATRAPQKLQYGAFLLNSGKTNEGKEYLTGITKAAPDFLPAWMMLAENAFSEKQFSESKKLVTEALARDQDYYDAILLSGRLALATGETNEAVKVLERLSTLYPKSPQAHYFSGIAHLQLNDPVKALAEFNEAVKLFPDFEDALVQQAQLNIRQNNASAAVDSLTELIKRRPVKSSTYLTLSGAYLSRGNFDEALALYRQMEKSFPQDPQIPLLTGTVLQRQGKTSEARDAFLKSFQMTTNNLQALELLVNLDLAEKKFTEATQRVQSEMPTQPQSPELPVLLGKILLAQQKNDEAEQAFRKALEIKPDFLPARRFLVDLYVSSKKYPRAIEEIQKTLAANADDQSMLLQLGLVQSELKNYSAAAEAYEKLLALNPNASAVYNNLAYIYSENLNQLDKAYDAARKARELLPDEPSTADTFGWVLYRRGEYSRALAPLQQSAEKLSQQPDVLFHLGMTQYMLGQADAARDSLDRALKVSQTFIGNNEATTRLAVLNVDPKDSNAAAALEKVLSEHPDDPIALSKLAGIYETNQQLDKALKLYEKAVAGNPQSLVANLKLAQLYSGPFKDNRKALQYAKVARDLAPGDPDVAYTLGKLAYASGDYVWSVSLLQESQRKLPKNAELLCDLAYSLLTIGRVSDAATSMRDALDSDPNFSRTRQAKNFLSLLAVQSSLKTPTSAEPLVQETLKASPNDLAAQSAQGIIQLQQGASAAARKTFETVLQQYPQFFPANKYLAALYALPDGDVQKAYDFAVKARASFPTDPDVAKTLGILAYKKNDFARAAQLLKESSLKLIQDPEVFFYLGMAQNNLKQSAESKTSLNQAITLGLDPKLATQAKAILTPPAK